MAEIKVGDTNLEVVANGLTPVIYHAVFTEDIVEKMDHFGSEDPHTTIFTAMKMAFIMNKQAKAKDIASCFKLTEKQFYKWLEGFGTMDLTNAAYDIIGFYMEQKKGTATPKK